MTKKNIDIQGNVYSFEHRLRTASKRSENAVLRQIPLKVGGRVQNKHKKDKIACWKKGYVPEPQKMQRA